VQLLRILVHIYVCLAEKFPFLPEEHREPRLFILVFSAGIVEFQVQCGRKLVL